MLLVKAIKEKRAKHLRRQMHIRKKVHGTPERPRLAVHRTLKHIYVQVIDDYSGRTLASASTTMKSVREGLRSGGNIAAAKKVGAEIARIAKAAGITKVVFDRGGFKYHGRVKALADAAREGGLQF